MSQTEATKAAVAEDLTETTRSFVRTVKTAAQRKYTAEEKIRIVLEGFRRGTTVSDLCRREGSQPSHRMETHGENQAPAHSFSSSANNLSSLRLRLGEYPGALHVRTVSDDSVGGFTASAVRFLRRWHTGASLGCRDGF